MLTLTDHNRVLAIVNGRACFGRRAAWLVRPLNFSESKGWTKLVPAHRRLPSRIFKKMPTRNIVRRGAQVAVLTTVTGLVVWSASQFLPYQEVALHQVVTGIPLILIFVIIFASRDQRHPPVKKRPPGRAEADLDSWNR